LSVRAIAKLGPTKRVKYIIDYRIMTGLPKELRSKDFFLIGLEGVLPELRVPKVEKQELPIPLLNIQGISVYS
jgi:hypothetical protein